MSVDVWALLQRHYPDLQDLPDPNKVDIRTWEPKDPDGFFGPIERINAWGKIQDPEVRGRILRLHKKRQYEKKRARQRAEDERKAKLRHPPSNCRREGNTVRWDPPNKGGISPDWYWVEAQTSDGSYTRLQPPIYPREELVRHLYGDAPARVAAYYVDEPQSLGWGFRYGPLLERPEEKPDIGRMERIKAAIPDCPGPRMKSRPRGAPWLYFLRRHSGIPDIKPSERNRAWRELHE